MATIRCANAKFHCLECGELFGTPHIVRESRGEFWGAPCYEDVGCCPYCGGEYEETVEEPEPVGFWVSASTATGELFGATIDAVDDGDLFDKFDEKYPDCEICDYGSYDDIR